MRRLAAMCASLALCICKPAGAASASAQVAVSVIDSVSVMSVLVAPLNLAELLNALQSRAATSNTGSRLIRLASPFPASPPLARAEPGMAAAMAGALAALQGAGSLLQGDLAAAVSLAEAGPGAEDEARVSITVAFN